MFLKCLSHLSESKVSQETDLDTDVLTVVVLTDDVRNVDRIDCIY